MRAILGLGSILLALFGLPAAAEDSRRTSLDDLVAAVVHIKTSINPEGTSVDNLGRQREGSGVVIDESGLILTIGYLMVEAQSAEVITNDGRTLPAAVVGYDHETGFGVLRTLEPPRLKPLPLGRSADVKEQDPALVASYGGAAMVLPVRIASRREFAGSWEYLVDNAIFTNPPHPAWSGAALINREGKLIGIGSLIVGNAKGEEEPSPGNMFVPIDLVGPILGDLLDKGRISGTGRPWIGLNAQAVHGRLFVGRVTPGSPAERAGLHKGDIIAGIGGEKTRTLAEFYRKMWALGAAGVKVPVDVLSDDNARRVDVESVNRLDTLKLQTTY